MTTGLPRLRRIAAETGEPAPRFDASEASPAEQVGEDGLEGRVNALYDELFCTGKHLHAKVPIDPKAIIRRALATPEQPGSAVQGDRELIRRLYVELLWCDRQLVGRGCKQGGSVRDVLADALEYLKSTPPPAPAAEQAQPEARGVDDAMVERAKYACGGDKGAYWPPETDDEWRTVLTAALAGKAQEESNGK